MSEGEVGLSWSANAIARSPHRLSSGTAVGCSMGGRFCAVTCMCKCVSAGHVSNAHLPECPFAFGMLLSCAGQAGVWWAGKQGYFRHGVCVCGVHVTGCIYTWALACNPIKLPLSWLSGVRLSLVGALASPRYALDGSIGLHQMSSGVIQASREMWGVGVAQPSCHLCWLRVDRSSCWAG